MLRAGDKRFALLLHHVVFFLRHGAAYQIGASIRIAAERPADLHDLFLIDDTTVCDIQDRLEQRVLIGDKFRVVAVSDVGRNRFHWTGPVKRNDGDQIFDGGGAKLCDDGAHSRRFELEHPNALSLCQHGEGFRIVERHRVRRESGMCFGRLFFGVADDRQRAQAEKIHFEQSKLLKRRHCKLCDRHRFLRLIKRHVAVHRIAGDYDAGRVCRRVARHPLDLARHIKQFRNPLVLSAHRLEIGGNSERLIQRHLQFIRHKLCN